jgi:hypothetical protein
MAQPWVGVLDKACDWAKGTVSATDATTALIKGEYNGCTYDGRVIYTDLAQSGVTQDGQEAFSLLKFLNNFMNTRQPLTGDCRTFADFLCCLSGSIGATPLQVQRSASAHDINSNANCSFNTNFGYEAHPIQGQADNGVAWHFHQWAVASSSIYDGAFQLATDQTTVHYYPTNLSPLISTSLTDFYNKLVDKSAPICWQPQTAFTPSVVN